MFGMKRIIKSLAVELAICVVFTGLLLGINLLLI